ncbi:MAG: recombination regulator RecX [Haliea sp.]|jgi:regulatory protein|nr:recombination regulator RecX [Haliea sp.]
MPDLSEQAFNSSTDGRPSEIRRTAMDLLARREHSRRELKQKLKKRFRDDALIEEQLDTLAEENLQSDTRYAESFLRQRFNRGHGPVRIRQEMRQKGIPDSDIQSVFASGEYDWYTSAEEVLLRKFGPEPPEDIKEKARRARFMQYRGFESEHYQHILEH